MESSIELKFLEEQIFIIMLCSKDMMLVQMYLVMLKLIILKDINMYRCKERISFNQTINMDKNDKVCN